MARVHFNMPPELIECAGAFGDASRVCLVCLMVARGVQLERDRDVWQKAADDGSSKQLWMPYPADGPDIREAVMHGISDMLPGAGLVPVCWDHLAGIVISQAPVAPQIVPAKGPLPPGLARGR